MRTAPVPCVLALVASLAAQGYSSGFESLAASASGTPASGQDGFYVAPITGSLDGAFYTYSGNTIGVPNNPSGGYQFYCGVGTTAPCRAQRNVTPPVNSRCAIQYNVLVNFVGTGTPLDFAGGVSLQPNAAVPPTFPNAAVFANLVCQWTNTAVAPLTWDLVVSYGPTLAGVVTPIPNPAFTNLPVNVWHRLGATIDLRTKEYINFTVIHGVTNVTTVYTPPAPVPMANQASTWLPTDFRLFTGNVGNLFAIDNFSVTFGATYEPFGAGCPGSLGTPTLTAASLPMIGTTLNVVYGNLPLNVVVHITGFSNTLALGSIPLPYNLSGNGFPGCSMLVDPLVTELVVGGTWQFSIPLRPIYLGAEFFNQGASLDSTAPGLSFGDGGRAVVGR